MQGTEKSYNSQYCGKFKNNIQGKGTEIIWFSLHPLPSAGGPNKDPTKTPPEG